MQGAQLLLAAAAASASFVAPAQRTRLPSCGHAARAHRGQLQMSAPTETAPKSFVQTEMRGAAMKLHTRDQSKEGEQAAQRPVSKWEPGREEYLQFLVDSRHVYSCFEDIVNENDILASWRDSGLERTAALDKDIAWFESEGLKPPPVGTRGVPSVAMPAQSSAQRSIVCAYGEEYVAKLRGIAADGRFETLTCHFYNHYFAHTAGGRMIGKMMADKLLDGRTLEFYRWERGDPKEVLLPRLREQIDAFAETWTREQKDACLAETAASFKGSGSLLKYLREPSAVAAEPS